MSLASALLVACASGRGGSTDAVGSSDAMGSAAPSSSVGPGARSPDGTSIDTVSSSDPGVPRGPGPGGTDARLPDATPSASSPVASASASASAAAGPPPTFDVKSDCPDTLVLFLGDKPKHSTGKEVSVAGRTTQTFPRGADGTATVWIVDGKGEGVASVRIGASSKRAVIGLNCRSVQAE